ncbi:hypothetical protein ACHAXR_003219, partial [Thalassiosira sp. AJA248-18]
MKFTIKWEMHGYFVELRRMIGNPEHSGHPRPLNPTELPVPTRLLSKEALNDVKLVTETHTSCKMARNFIYKKIGHFVDSAKIAWLQTKSDNPKKKDDIHNMLGMFKSSNEVRFTSLSDVPIDQYCYVDPHEKSTDAADTVTMSLSKDENNNITQEDIRTKKSLAEIDVLAKKERIARKLKKKDELFISIAWTVMPLFRFFLLCPEVIWCDVTSHSNNKGFSLFTFSCRTSLDRQALFLWIWIPNEQRFSFRWVFQHAIPILIPACHRNRVKFIMKDGDTQQRNEIIGALKNVFPNAVEGGCGYHIVHQSWTREAPGVTCVRTSSQAVFLAIKHKIMKWCYSWMKPGYVESEVEYAISKYLLLQFICSASVLSALEGKTHLVVHILRWLKGYVLPWDTLYLFYLRKNVRHYLTTHGSAHEGTNFGLKNHSAPMQPTMSMSTSAKTLNLQADLKAAELKKIAHDDFVNTNKHWSDKPTSKFTTTFGEGLLKSVYDRSGLYRSRRVGLREFQVDFIGENEIEEDINVSDAELFAQTPLPLFGRIRNVKVTDDGNLICDCCRFQHSGYFCEHVVSVSTKISWYMHLAFKKSTPIHIQQMYHRLACQDFSGPHLVLDLPDPEVWPIESFIPHLPAVERLKNYVDSDVSEMNNFFEASFSQSFEPDNDVTDVDDEVFLVMSEMLKGSITSNSEDKFAESLNDASVPESVAAKTKTRDIFAETLGDPYH